MNKITKSLICCAVLLFASCRESRQGETLSAGKEAKMELVAKSANNQAFGIAKVNCGLQSAPNSNAKPLMFVPAKAKIKILEKQGETTVNGKKIAWYKVRYSVCTNPNALKVKPTQNIMDVARNDAPYGSIEGWISSEFLELDMGC